MPTLLSLPDELLLQILSHNTPQNLRSRSDFVTHIRHGALNKRLLRLHRDSFFHTFIHRFSITCLYSAPSPRCAYTQVHIDGVLTARTSFLEQVRKVDVRLYVYYKESVETAVEEVRGVLQRYNKLRWLRVGVSTGSWEVAEVLGRRIGEVVEEERAVGRAAEKRVEVFVEMELMGVVVEGK
ncbi:hypothetical protein M409DRAFT_29406 [Zasmidium cellare ATCC 36951]|uniref:F-box domain-containing protein n=1 Tax=Zasmidium cellare ATCC 36951 TaxID=1080233 RepID=A0A6A6C2Y6_ZASCE|nr:uncharacterized protein M409DRAFT_29406 [Zasmidium cellare ATCC 36951]KAF2160109.1 hypothetical protein M409DRAFT_29406 [Zasmidium cellare ATCC 36951]